MPSRRTGGVVAARRFIALRELALELARKVRNVSRVGSQTDEKLTFNSFQMQNEHLTALFG